MMCNYAGAYFQIGVERVIRCVVVFGLVFFVGFLFFFFALPSQHPCEPVGDVGEGSLQPLAELRVCVCVGVGTERAFPEKDLAFLQLGFVLIKLICAFCLPLLLCISLYIL